VGSPTTEVFFVYNLADGTPLTGAAAGMSFDTYKNSSGTNITPQPTITEIGGGAYGFTPSFSDANHGTVYVLNTGTNGNPARVARYMRPEDYAPDSILTIVTQIQSYTEGKWKIFTTGPDANRLVIYDVDGVTVLKKYDLQDASGSPTYINPFVRIPV